MIRALRWLLSRRHAHGGHIGPPTNEAMLANLEQGHGSGDDELDPDDPIVRLVRQARAVRDGSITRYLGDEVNTCPTCWQNTELSVFAHSSSLSHEYAIRIATYCPNCPPEGDEDE